jgi:predicted transposase
MKQTLLVKLVPSPEDHTALLRTLETFNAACNAIAQVAYEQRVANKLRLQPLVYYDIRQQFGLSAQMVIRAIAKVSEAYQRDRSSKPTFRRHGAMPYDQRICSFPAPERVSLLTLDGRVVVPFRFGAYAAGMLQRTRASAICSIASAATPFSWRLPSMRPNRHPTTLATTWALIWA